MVVINKMLKERKRGVKVIEGRDRDGREGVRMEETGK